MPVLKFVGGHPAGAGSAGMVIEGGPELLYMRKGATMESCASYPSTQMVHSFQDHTGIGIGNLHTMARTSSTTMTVKGDKSRNNKYKTNQSLIALVR